ncbi:uncharacterized protein LOC143246966 [Tachypleus tridentatus]|uniref:uncharacterized protein LOC143246966 n=1 Tax=Tachypleus tridentatus TaxID=6853 RepID=UPI003FD2ABDF
MKLLLYCAVATVFIVITAGVDSQTPVYEYRSVYNSGNQPTFFPRSDGYSRLGRSYSYGYDYGNIGYDFRGYHSNVPNVLNDYSDAYPYDVREVNYRYNQGYGSQYGYY